MAGRHDIVITPCAGCGRQTAYVQFRPSEDKRSQPGFRSAVDMAAGRKTYCHSCRPDESNVIHATADNDVLVPDVVTRKIQPTTDTKPAAKRKSGNVKRQQDMADVMSADDMQAVFAAFAEIAQRLGGK